MCAAGLVGRTEAVQIEPFDEQTKAHLLPGGRAQVINGLTASVQPFSGTTHSFVAVFASLGVVVTVTWSGDPEVGQRILGSFHA
jgi:hypothetical protein